MYSDSTENLNEKEDDMNGSETCRVSKAGDDGNDTEDCIERDAQANDGEAYNANVITNNNNITSKTENELDSKTSLTNRKKRIILSTASCIPWEAGSYRKETQKGMTPIGGYRSAILKVKDTKHFKAPSDGVIPLQSGVANKEASQSNLLPFGATRPNVPLVKYKSNQTPGISRESSAFLTKWTTPVLENEEPFPTIGGRRTLPSARKDRRGDSIIPRLHDQTPFSAAGTSAGIAGFMKNRQLVAQVQRLELSSASDEAKILKIKRSTPWQTGNLLAQSQTKTGGFMHPRDVVNMTYYDHVKS